MLGRFWAFRRKRAQETQYQTLQSPWPELKEWLLMQGAEDNSDPLMGTRNEGWQRHLENCFIVILLHCKRLFYWVKGINNFSKETTQTSYREQYKMVACKIQLKTLIDLWYQTSVSHKDCGHRTHTFQERVKLFMDYVIKLVVRTPKHNYPFLCICKKHQGKLRVGVTSFELIGYFSLYLNRYKG